VSQTVIENGLFYKLSVVKLTKSRFDKKCEVHCVVQKPVNYGKTNNNNNNNKKL